MPAAVSRRSFLAAASFALAAACTKQRRARPAHGSVIVANHPVYIDTATNPGFERTTGITVEYHEEINDDAAWLASVTPQLAHGESIDRDVVVVRDWVARRLADNHFLDGRGAADGNHPSSGGPDGDPVPWAMGMVGVAYDRRATGADVHRMAELFQPPLHGSVALPAEMRLALGIALLADRVDPSTVTVDQATATASRLNNSVLVGQVRLFDRARPIDQVANGTVAAAVVSASDMFGLDRDHPDIRFVIPDDGGLLLTDVIAIPARPPNLEAARAYVEYATSATVAAERFRALPVLWPAGPVDDLLRTNAPAVYGDPLRNPPPDVRARLRPFRYLDAADDRAVTAAFATVLESARHKVR